MGWIETNARNFNSELPFAAPIWSSRFTVFSAIFRRLNETVIVYGGVNDGKATKSISVSINSDDKVQISPSSVLICILHSCNRRLYVINNNLVIKLAARGCVFRVAHSLPMPQHNFTAKLIEYKRSSERDQITFLLWGSGVRVIHIRWHALSKYQIERRQTCMGYDDVCNKIVETIAMPASAN